MRNSTSRGQKWLQSQSYAKRAKSNIPSKSERRSRQFSIAGQRMLMGCHNQLHHYWVAALSTWSSYRLIWHRLHHRFSESLVCGIWWNDRLWMETSLYLMGAVGKKTREARVRKCMPHSTPWAVNDLHRSTHHIKSAAAAVNGGWLSQSYARRAKSNIPSKSERRSRQFSIAGRSMLMGCHNQLQQFWSAALSMYKKFLSVNRTQLASYCRFCSSLVCGDR